MTNEFIFRMPNGEEAGRADNITGLAEALKKVPLASIEYHHKNRHFSPWLINQKKSKLAENIEKEKAIGEKLRKNLLKTVKKAM